MKRKAIGQIRRFIRSSCWGKTKIFSAPDHNELGINKISRHQATERHQHFCRYFWCFHCLSRTQLQATLCENLFSVQSPCRIKSFEAIPIPGLETCRNIHSGFSRAAVPPDSVEEKTKKTSCGITFPTVSPSFHGSDTQKLGFLFRCHRLQKKRDWAFQDHLQKLDAG